MVNNRKNGSNGRNASSESLLTVKEVAFILHVHANTVRRWSDSGLLKTYRISSRGDRRFKKEDIDQFLVRSGAHETKDRSMMKIDSLWACGELSKIS
jgi:excisionase family DNA binding protein